jgi:excinuclease UvrABC nuclease subunit
MARTRGEDAMPFENQPYPWSRDSVVENAPRRSGVYGLYSALWIYIGEADDLRERIMEHFNGDSPRITRYVPTYFVFELIDNRTARESRYRELVRQHGPVCNAGQVSQE